MTRQLRTWFEFFAGGGMARLGLADNWECKFANDICEKKAAAYRAFFGTSQELQIADIAELKVRDLPGTPDLVWASFPCQDLSLAGSGAGLAGERSGTFRPFWHLIEGMALEGRGPKIVVLENVVGALTSHGGKDFTSILSSFANSGYRVGAMIIDAVHFLPQSRPRLFVVGVHGEIPNSPELRSAVPSEPWHTRSLIKLHAKLPENLAENWVWWRLPVPRQSVQSLSSLIEKHPTEVAWHSPTETNRILRLMTARHRKRVLDAMQAGGRHVGTIYKRTRPARNGVKKQRAEVRFDGIAGCLRTPAGGSSRQTVIVVEKDQVMTRLLSPREAARLMGVPEEYPLPSSYNDAYHLFGDGVAIPVVGWLEKHLLLPLLAHLNAARAA
jgi:DNA (cytosine-5)-methyltransferase 1